MHLKPTARNMRRLSRSTEYTATFPHCGQDWTLLFIELHSTRLRLLPRDRHCSFGHHWPASGAHFAMHLLFCGHCVSSLLAPPGLGNSLAVGCSKPLAQKAWMGLDSCHAALARHAHRRRLNYLRLRSFGRTITSCSSCMTMLKGWKACPLPPIGLSGSAGATSGLGIMSPVSSH